jgi:hypothetical protein
LRWIISVNSAIFGVTSIIGIGVPQINLHAVPRAPLYVPTLRHF